MYSLKRKRIANFSALPEDVMVKIWSFLPAKSVLRLKCVQRSWNNLVNVLVKTPSFVADHLNNTRAVSSSLIVVVTSNNYSYRTMFPKCDGMVCTVTKYSSKYIPIWNPATGEQMRLQFRSRGENIAAGFGYDPVSCAYKLVVISMQRWVEITAKVCTIGEDTWRVVKTAAIKDLYSFDSRSDSGLCCEGVISWIGWWPHGVEKVVCFNTNTEKFETVAFPIETDGRMVPSETVWECEHYRENLRLARWMGSVALMHYGRNQMSPVDLWVMSKTKKTWINKRFMFARPSKKIEHMEDFFYVLDKTQTKIGEWIHRISICAHADYSFSALPTV